MKSHGSMTRAIAAATRAASCVAVAWLAAATVAQAADLTPQEKAVGRRRQEGRRGHLLNPMFSDRTGERLGQAFIKRYDLGADFKFNNLRKGTGADGGAGAPGNPGQESSRSTSSW